MLYPPEAVEVAPFFRRFRNFTLTGFLDVGAIVAAQKRHQQDPHAETSLKYRMTKEQQREQQNRFGWLCCEGLHKPTATRLQLMPVFFGMDPEFRFSTERAPCPQRPFILFFKGNDDWSLGARFASAVERQEYLDLFQEEAGAEPLEGWN